MAVNKYSATFASGSQNGTITCTNAVTVNNTLVVQFDGANFATMTPVTVTDNASPPNTYVQQAYLNGGTGGSASAWCFVAKNVQAAAAGALVISVGLFSASNDTALVITVTEEVTSTPRVGNQNTGNFGGTTASVSLASTAATDICLAFVVNQAEGTAPTVGAFGSTTASSLLSANVTDSWLLEEGISSGGTISATANIVSGSNWTMVAVALQLCPAITAQPTNASAVITGGGATASFSVSATASAGGGSLSYQWQLNGVNVSGGSGGTTATYTTPAATIALNGGSYTCIVTDSNGSNTSNAAILTTYWPVTGNLSVTPNGALPYGGLPTTAAPPNVIFFSMGGWQ